MKKYFKEPLLHFLVIGAMIFVLFSVINKEEFSVDEKKIIVSSAEINRLSSNWSKKWQRLPTEIELQGLVASYIKKEVYYREALALGLDQNDTILKRRLVQKMEFLSNDLAELNSPDQAILREYFTDHQDKYELPAQLSFSHIYFSSDKRGRQAVQDAADVLVKLRATSPPVSHTAEHGDSFMLEYSFSQETPPEVARTFGNHFASELFKIETTSWQGPIASSYGMHLVRISQKVSSRVPEFSSLIDKIRTDWMFEERRKTNKAIYERFKERYKIVIEMPTEPQIIAAKLAEGGAS